MKKTFWKKMTGSLLALCLLFSACPGFSETAQKEENAFPHPLLSLYLAGESLLTQESNMTVSAEADFALDGEHFKHAAGVYAQDGTSSYQSISLKTPMRYQEGTRTNGYCVVDQGGSCYAIERAHIDYDESRIFYFYSSPKDHALRESVASRTLLMLGRGIADALDSQLPCTVADLPDASGHVITLDLAGEDLPSLAVSGLNLFWQKAVEHFLGITYQDMPLDSDADIEDYFTLTDGIAYGVLDLNPTHLKAEARLDMEGRLTDLAGSAALTLICRNGSVRKMDVSFSLKAGNYGSTSMMEVIPREDRPETADWLGMPVEKLPLFFGMREATGQNWEAEGLPSIPLLKSRLAHRDLLTAEDAASYAGEVAALDGLALSEAKDLSWSAERTGEGLYLAEGVLPDGSPALSLILDETGEVLQIVNHLTRQDSAFEWYSEFLDTPPVTEWRGEIGILLWLFSENLNPGSTLISSETLRSLEASGLGYTSYSSALRAGDQEFVVMYGVLRQDPSQHVKFVVQTRPQMRVVVMDTFIDPDEAGNG